MTWASGNKFECVVMKREGLCMHTIEYEDGGLATFKLSEGRRGFETGKYIVLPDALSEEEGRAMVMRQVKRTFRYLLDSVRKYHDPKPLVDACHSLKLEFNVFQQNDAAEFADKLLDRLDESFKGTPREGLVYKMFSGNTFAQSISKDEKFVVFVSDL